MSNSSPQPIASPIACVVGFVGGYAVAVLLTGIWVASFGAGGLGARLLGSIGLWIGFIGAPIAVARARQLNWRDAVGLSVRPAHDLVLGVPLGIATQLLAIPGLYWLIERITGPLDIEAPAQRLIDRANGAGWIALIVVVGIGAPVAEEIFFRGLLMRTLQSRFGANIAILATSLIFAASHFQVAQFPGLLIAGLVFALLAVRFERLGPAIACHIAFNLTTLVQLAR